MSYHGDFQDWICDHDEEALLDYLDEKPERWDSVIAFLIDEKHEELLSKVLRAYLTYAPLDKIARFEEWARERFEARP